MKTETRKLAEQIQKKTGESLVYINFLAMGYVQAGLCQNRLEALRYMAGL